jgi:pyruvate,water dikinase
MKKLKTKLKGITACPGKVKGKIWKIENPIEVPPSKKGYIVIIPFTTPIIALAISESKAIICEKGGITSHAAIIAREFGIPCIVGVKNLLETFKNGQTVIVDADKAEIYEA